MTVNELMISGAASDKKALNDLFCENKGLIYLVVNRFKNYNEDADDLFQVASIGLSRH